MGPEYWARYAAAIRRAAFLAHYGHQPDSEIRAMPELRQRCLQRALIEILNAERTPAEDEPKARASLAEVQDSALQDPANPLRLLATPSASGAAKR